MYSLTFFVSPYFPVSFALFFFFFVQTLSRVLYPPFFQSSLSLSQCVPLRKIDLFFPRHHVPHFLSLLEKSEARPFPSDQHDSFSMPPAADADPLLFPSEPIDLFLRPFRKVQDRFFMKDSTIFHSQLHDPNRHPHLVLVFFPAIIFYRKVSSTIFVSSPVQAP